MRHLVAISCALCAGLALPLAAWAEDGASDVAPGRVKEAVIAFYGSDPEVGMPTPEGKVTTLGGAISAGFFGNTSNSGQNTEDAPDRGHGVTPSISPGPFTVGGGFATLGGLITGSANLPSAD